MTESIANCHAAKKYFRFDVRRQWRARRPRSCPKCGMALERDPQDRHRPSSIYTCPMHPQIEQDKAGNCPICGMALEPKNVVAGGEEENAELRDMTRRFWLGAVLSLPVLILGMAHLSPATGPCIVT